MPDAKPLMPGNALTWPGAEECFEELAEAKAAVVGLENIPEKNVNGFARLQGL